MRRAWTRAWPPPIGQACLLSSFLPGELVMWVIGTLTHAWVGRGLLRPEEPLRRNVTGVPREEGSR